MCKCFDMRCVPVLAMYRSIEKVEANANASRLGKLLKYYQIGAVGNQLKDIGRVQWCTVLCTKCMQGPNSYSTSLRELNPALKWDMSMTHTPP